MPFCLLRCSWLLPVLFWQGEPSEMQSHLDLLEMYQVSSLFCTWENRMMQCRRYADGGESRLKSIGCMYLQSNKAGSSSFVTHTTAKPMWAELLLIISTLIINYINHIDGLTSPSIHVSVIWFVSCRLTLYKIPWCSKKNIWKNYRWPSAKLNEKG